MRFGREDAMTNFTKINSSLVRCPLCCRLPVSPKVVAFVQTPPPKCPRPPNRQRAGGAALVWQPSGLRAEHQGVAASSIGRVAARGSVRPEAATERSKQHAICTSPPDTAPSWPEASAGRAPRCRRFRQGHTWCPASADRPRHPATPAGQARRRRRFGEPPDSPTGREAETRTRPYPRLD